MRKADNLPRYCVVVKKSRSLNFLDTSGPAWPVTVVLYLLQLRHFVLITQQDTLQYIPVYSIHGTYLNGFICISVSSKEPQGMVKILESSYRCRYFRNVLVFTPKFRYTVPLNLTALGSATLHAGGA